MNRRELLQAATAGLALAAIRTSPVSATPIPPSNQSLPNIILCMSDDQGWGDVGYNGHPVLQTPNLDAMAANALRFDRFYSAAPVCSPTRGSVMTGRHPNRYGCFHANYPLPATEVTIAKLLQQAGYMTGHFGKWHLGSVHAGATTSPGAHGFDEWFSIEKAFEYNPEFRRNGVMTPTVGEGSMVVVNAALEFIQRQTASKQPFLAVVWFSSPHKPHQASQADKSIYAGETEKLQQFYGEITAMDRAIGRLRDELRTLGIARNTILWFSSDNGGLRDLGTTGGKSYKGSLYEGGVRVPALLEWPERIPVPQTSTVPCVTSDILPTLLEITGTAPEAGRHLDGISLVPLIEGKMDSRPEPIGFWHYPASLYLLPSAGSIGQPRKEGSAFPGKSAWLDWPWKLHRFEDVETGKYGVELYNTIC